MTAPTDAELTAVLARAFAEHEPPGAEEAVRRALLRAERQAPRVTRRRRGSRLVAGAAAVVLLGGVAVLASRREAPTVVGGATPTTYASVLTASDAANAAATERLVEESLQSLEMPAGAEEMPRSSVVDTPPDTGSVAVAARYWSVPAVPASVESFLTGHGPAGFADVSWRSGPATPEGAARTLGWRRGVALATTSDLSVEVTISPAPGGSRVLAKAFGRWRPARGPGSVLGDPVTSVDVVVEDLPAGSGVAATRSARLGADDAARFASLVNAALPVGEWTSSCPASSGTTTVTLAFRTSTHDVLVVASPDCPGTMTVRRDGASTGPALEGGSSLARLARERVEAVGPTTGTVDLGAARAVAQAFLGHAVAGDCAAALALWAPRDPALRGDTGPSIACAELRDASLQPVGTPDVTGSGSAVVVVGAAVGDLGRPRAGAPEVAVTVEAQADGTWRVSDVRVDNGP